MKQINDNTIVGYDENGNEIEAERLQKWAYNQIEVAPELLEACKEVKPALNSMPCTCNDDRDCQRCYALRKINQAIAKAEGGK